MGTNHETSFFITGHDNQYTDRLIGLIRMLASSDTLFCLLSCAASCVAASWTQTTKHSCHCAGDSSIFRDESVHWHYFYALASGYCPSFSISCSRHSNSLVSITLRFYGLKWWSLWSIEMTRRKQFNER